MLVEYGERRPQCYTVYERFRSANLGSPVVDADSQGEI